MKELFKRQRRLIALYAVWFFIHLVFLFSSDKRDSYNFWPFEGGLKWAYDFSEFLVYAIGPGILIFAYLMFKKRD